MVADFCNLCGEGAEGGLLFQCCEKTCSMVVHSNCLPKGARAGLRVLRQEWRCAGCWTRLEAMHLQKEGEIGQESPVGAEKKGSLTGSKKSLKGKSVREGLGGLAKKSRRPGLTIRSEGTSKAKKAVGIEKKGTGIGSKEATTVKKSLARVQRKSFDDGANQSLEANSGQKTPLKKIFETGSRRGLRANIPLESTEDNGAKSGAKLSSRKQGGSKRKGPELGCPNGSKKLRGVADLFPPISPDTVCGVCKRPEPDDCMLLCESVGCEETSHTFCCKPPLKAVPKGAWYCQKCLQKGKEEKATLGESGKEHRQQRTGRRERVSKTKVKETDKKHITGLDRDDSESGSSINPDAECDVCGKPDNDHVMLLCSTDKCEARQHTFCCTPPLRRVPAGDWFCPKCEASEKESLVEDGIRCLFQAGKKQKQCTNLRVHVGKHCRLHTEFPERPATREARSAEPTKHHQGENESQGAEAAEVDYDSSVDPDKDCDVCGSPDDSDVMLLCSGLNCKHAQHTFCCNPKLAKVPSVDWFCPACSGNDSTGKFAAVAEPEDDGVRCTLLSRSANGLKQCIAQRQAGSRRCAYHRGQKVQQTKPFKKRKTDKQTGRERAGGEKQMGQWSEGLLDDGVRCTHYSRREGVRVYQCSGKRVPGFKMCQRHRDYKKRRQERLAKAQEKELSLVGSGAKFVIRRQLVKKVQKASTGQKVDANDPPRKAKQAEVASKACPESSASRGKKRGNPNKQVAPAAKRPKRAPGMAIDKAHNARIAEGPSTGEDVPACSLPSKGCSTPPGHVSKSKTVAGSPSTEGSPFDPVSLFLRDELVTPPQQRSPVAKSPGGKNAGETTPPNGARLEPVSPQAREEVLLMGPEGSARETTGAKESAFLAENSELLRKLVAEELEKQIRAGTFILSPPSKLALDEGGQGVGGKEPPERGERAASFETSLQPGAKDKSREPERLRKVHNEEENFGQAPPNGAELERTQRESEEGIETCAQRTGPLEQDSGQAAPERMMPEAVAANSLAVQARAPLTATVSEQGASGKAEQMAAEQPAVEQTATKQTALEQTAAEDTAAEQTAMEEMAPEETAAKQMAAKESATEELAAEQTARDNMVPGQTATERAASEHPAGEEAAAESMASEEKPGERTKYESEGNVVPDCAGSDYKDGDSAAEPMVQVTSAEDTRAGAEAAATRDGANVARDAEKTDAKAPTEPAELFERDRDRQRQKRMATSLAAMRRQSFEEACHALGPAECTPKPQTLDLDLDRPAKANREEPQVPSPGGSFVSQTSAVTDSQKSDQKRAQEAPPAKHPNLVPESGLRIPKAEPKGSPEMLAPQSASVSDYGSMDARRKTSAVTDPQPEGAEEAAKSLLLANPSNVTSEPELLIPKEEPGAGLPSSGKQSGCPPASAAASDSGSKDARARSNITSEPELLVPKEEVGAPPVELAPRSGCRAAGASVPTIGSKDARPGPFDVVTNLRQFWKRPRLNLQ